MTTIPGRVASKAAAAGGRVEMRKYKWAVVSVLALCACGSDEDPPGRQQAASSGTGAAGADGGAGGVGGQGANGGGGSGGTAPQGPGCPEGDVPQVVAAAVPKLVSVTATDTYVAWLVDTFDPPGSGSVTRLRFGEDAPEVLVEGMDAGGQRIIGNASHIAWSTIGAGVRFLSVDGGAPGSGGGFLIAGLALTDDYLYVAAAGGIVGDGAVTRTPLAGGPEEQIFDLQPAFDFVSFTNALALGPDNAWALVTDDAGDVPFDVLVRGAPIDGGGASTLKSLGNVDYAIAVADAEAVYVADDDQLAAHALVGGTTTPLADLGGYNGFDQPTRLAQDADSVYWVKSSGGGSAIMRAAKDGSGAEELVSGAGTWEDLSVTSGAFFWLRRVDGADAADVVCQRR